MSVSLVYRYKQPALIEEFLGVDEYDIEHTRTVANPNVGKWKTVTVKVEDGDKKAIHPGAGIKGGVYGIRTNNGNPVEIPSEFQNATSALIHFRNVEAADREATKAAIVAGEPIRKVGRPKKVLTVAQEADVYYKTKKTAAALDNNMRYVGSFVATLPDDIKPEEVTAQHVTDWFAGLVAKGKTHNVMEVAYRHVIAFLGNGHCRVLQEQFKKFPMLADLKKQFTPAENMKDNTDHFTLAEQAALRAAAKPGRETVLLEIGLQLGLREAEMIYAQWSWINVHTRTCKVPANMGDGKRTKSRKERTIRFGNGLAAILKAWKEKGECKGQSAYILCGDNGKERWRQELLDPIKKMAQRAGIDPKDAWVHKLRHSAITNWLHAGLPPVDCQRWAGHAKLETTCLYFGNLEDKEVTKRLDGFFK